MKYIKVVTQTKAKKENIIQESEDYFLISVKEKPERNMANKRIIEILALYFKVSVEKIRIVNGHRHPHKLISIDIK